MEQRSIRICPYAEADAERLSRLRTAIWGTDPTALRFYRFGPDREGDGFHRTLVAEAGGRIVGFGSLWVNRFHPYALYVGIGVHPVWRGCGVGTSLLRDLEDMNGSRLPMQTSAWEQGPGAGAFLARAGFQEVRRTYMPVLQLGLVDTDDYRGLLDQCCQAGYKICSLADLAGEPDRNRQVADLCREIYIATHQVNPPGRLTPAEWEELVFGEPLLEEASFVARRDGAYAAVALLHPGEEPGTVEAGWRGVAAWHRGAGGPGTGEPGTGEPGTEEHALMMALSISQVARAQAQGWICLQAEVDSTDPWALMMLDALPFDPAPAWVTYRRT